MKRQNRRQTVEDRQNMSKTGDSKHVEICMDCQNHLHQADTILSYYPTITSTTSCRLAQFLNHLHQTDTILSSLGQKLNNHTTRITTAPWPWHHGESRKARRGLEELTRWGCSLCRASHNGGSQGRQPSLPARSHPKSSNTTTSGIRTQLTEGVQLACNLENITNT